MGTTTGLRREIKRKFVPYLTERGFVIDERNSPTFLEFRRVTSDWVYLVDIQWEKSGDPRFVINFGKCPPTGITIRGQHYAPEEVCASWMPEYGRLQPHGGPSTANWFRLDKPLMKRLLSGEKSYPPEVVVAELKRLFAEVEAYWATGTVGKHLRIIRNAI